eukprot:629441-Rhodomonas_salina.2
MLVYQSELPGVRVLRARQPHWRSATLLDAIYGGISAIYGRNDTVNGCNATIYGRETAVYGRNTTTSWWNTAVDGRRLQTQMALTYKLTYKGFWGGL